MPHFFPSCFPSWCTHSSPTLFAQFALPLTFLLQCLLGSVPLSGTPQTRRCGVCSALLSLVVAHLKPDPALFSHPAPQISSCPAPVPRPSSSRPSLSLHPVSTPLPPRNTKRSGTRPSPLHSPPRSSKRIPSDRVQSPHGTVRGTWTGSQLIKAVNSFLESDHRLARMPGSGLHRQLKIQWDGRQLAVNIGQTGRVHAQGKGSGHFAQLLSLAHASSMGPASKPSQLSFTSFSSQSPTFCRRNLQARQEVPTIPPVETVSVLRFLSLFFFFKVSLGGFRFLLRVTSVHWFLSLCCFSAVL